MTFISTIAKKVAVAVIAASTIGGAMIATTTTASAGHSTGTWKYAGGAPYGYGYGYYAPPPRYNPGAAAAAVAGGIMLGTAGALAATGAYNGPAYAAPSCYYARQPVEDAWGNIYTRRVPVCD